MTQVGKFSLNEVLCPENPKTKLSIIEKPVSDSVSTLLSNFSKTIGIVSYEQKISLKQKSLETLSISNSIS